MFNLYPLTLKLFAFVHVGENNACIPPTLEGWVYIIPIHGPLYTWAQYTPTQPSKLLIEIFYKIRQCIPFLEKRLHNVYIVLGFSFNKALSLFYVCVHVINIHVFEELG